jgi:8-oxo-dGTP pyrophosphatase MutT (NUDIX family)
MSKYKTSYGLALCRYNKDANNCIEILSIKKRFTYYYFSFINGFYKSKAGRNDDISYIKYMFDNMTFQEKLTILSMNYGTMWWYIWLNNPEKGINMFEKINGKESSGNNILQAVNGYNSFFKRKSKFEKKFMQDGGKKMHDIINNSKCCEAIWEIPKGGQDSGETNLDTAIREFSEESQINPMYYNILYDVNPITITFKDSGVNYCHIYYLAELNELGYATRQIMKPKINFKSYKQLSEVADMRWININFINALDMPTKNKRNMIKLYNTIIKKFKIHNSHLYMK